MNLIEAIEEMEKGKKIKNKIWSAGHYIYMETKTGYILHHYPNGQTANFGLPTVCLKNDEWEIYQKPEEILDDEERRYLEEVIKPFKDKVKIFEKIAVYDKYEYIRINLDGLIDDERVVFPCFRKRTMYKGMETGRKYTLEELGLFDRKIY